MKEYRFKANQYDKLNELNELMPKGKEFKIDSYTGEAWIKITNEEHTPELVKLVELFCCFSYHKKQLSIKDCSHQDNKLIYEDTRETLF